MSRSALMVTSFVTLAVIAVTSTQVRAQRADAPFTVAETGKSYDVLDHAVKAIGNRQGTIVIRPGVYQQCAVQTEGVIAFRAAVPGQVIFDRATCEGKAALVLRGQGASVDGIIFQGMVVHDANGSGIRLEKGNLAITRSIFRDSEQGILTAEDLNGNVTIDQSTFSGLGRCDRGLSCAHSIYIGKYASLTVTNSRFERGNGGHYIKSRAARATITDNAIDDSMGNTTNYMIDLPHGAAGIISGNYFVQGKNKENTSALIAIAAEGRIYDSSALTIDDNDATLAPGATSTPGFLVNWSQDRVNLASNRLGRGIKPFEQK